MGSFPSELRVSSCSLAMVLPSNPLLLSSLVNEYKTRLLKWPKRDTQVAQAGTHRAPS
jgi:hypothetical protein